MTRKKISSGYIINLYGESFEESFGNYNLKKKLLVNPDLKSVKKSIRSCDLSDKPRVFKITVEEVTIDDQPRMSTKRSPRYE